MMWKRKATKNKNPYAPEGEHKTKHGFKSEDRILADLHATPTIASGALGIKSDGYTEGFRVECKSTNKKSISIKHEWLQKIRQEALETNRTPTVTISFVDNNGSPRDAASDWVMLPAYMFAEFESWLKAHS